MNLFFRLVRIFLAALFSKKTSKITDLYKLKFSVWLTDQDMFAHLTNSRYFSFADLGTINFIIRSNSWNTLRKKGWVPVILSEKVIITRMLKFPQAFTLETQVTCWDESYVGIRHTFVRKGRTHASVDLIAKFASRDRTPLTPQMVLTEIGNTETSPPLTDTFIELRRDIQNARQQG